MKLTHFMISQTACMSAGTGNVQAVWRLHTERVCSWEATKHSAGITYDICALIKCLLTFQNVCLIFTVMELSLLHT